MTAKGQYAADYGPEATRQARQACLLLSTRLGELLDDLVVVGGLVPSLIITPEEHVDLHVGTADLDLGLSVALLDAKQYTEVATRLAGAGFAADTNPTGNTTVQRWRGPAGVTVDFLIPPTAEATKGGTIQNLTPDFGAIVTPGLSLAFEDRLEVEISDALPGGEKATRTIYVCGAGAFLVLKALAFRGRSEPKDAYDLYYVLQNFAGAPDSIVQRMKGWGDVAEVRQAIEILGRDFSAPDSLGPANVARFLTGERNDEIEADVAGAVRELLRHVQS